MEIDFIIPWVDDTDPEWRSCYDFYSSQEDGLFNKNGERYRDWGLLRFWFRGVEQYAPWVRKVHFVTFGHYPEWLDLNHPRIHLVKHEDYIPARYLPTFSSHTIELNLHRIEGLAEHFVYFNDDIFLSAPVNPDDFFKNGLPRDVAVRSFIHLDKYGHIDLNNVTLINQHLRFWASYKKNWRKWYNFRYGIYGLLNVYFERYHDFIGLRQRHLANSFLKSTYQQVWNACADVLEETCLRKFRGEKDVNQWLFQYWQVASGAFFPQRYNFGSYCTANNLAFIQKTLSQRKTKLLCVNDSDLHSISAIKENLQQVFLDAFPRKSSFELY